MRISAGFVLILRPLRKEWRRSWFDLFTALRRQRTPVRGSAFARPALKPTTIRLENQALIRLTKDCRARRLRMISGTIWLTGTPAEGDVLLRSGDEFHLPDRWPFVLQAIGEAEICLLP